VDHERDRTRSHTQLPLVSLEGAHQKTLEKPANLPLPFSYVLHLSFPFFAHSGACGRAGESGKALELFQTMKDEGLSPDRVAFNALFSALRRAKDGEKVSGFYCDPSPLQWSVKIVIQFHFAPLIFTLMVGLLIILLVDNQSYELWGEICGVRSMTTKAIATANHAASPDIITVTDCIATLSRNGMLTEMDEVFGQAVQRGIVLRGNSLDGQWEVDLSGMPFPVARAACRYLLKQIQLYKSVEDLQDMVFITGVGMAQQRRRESTSTAKSSSVLEKDPTTSLRDYVQGILRSDLKPSLESTIPDRAKGTVMIGKGTLTRWLEVQSKR
jgi:pentatricopeptide repeat protein